MWPALRQDGNRIPTFWYTDTKPILTWYLVFHSQCFGIWLVLAILTNVYEAVNSVKRWNFPNILKLVRFRYFAWFLLVAGLVSILGFSVTDTTSADPVRVSRACDSASTKPHILYPAWYEVSFLSGFPTR